MGTAVGVLVVGVVLAFGAYFAFRGDEEVLPTPTPEPTTPATATATTPPTATQTATATPQPSATPAPTPTLPAGRRAEPAPIESLRVEPQAPPYVVVVTAGLPNGCAQPYTHEVSRQGDVFTVRLLNSVPTANVPCTLIYRTYEARVTISATLVAGRAYTVRVNDKQTTFTAR
jgi:hypothetical protein